MLAFVAVEGQQQGETRLVLQLCWCCVGVASEGERGDEDVPRGRSRDRRFQRVEARRTDVCDVARMSKDHLLHGGGYQDNNPFTSSALMDFGEEATHEESRGEDLERGEATLPVSDGAPLSPPPFVPTVEDAQEDRNRPVKETRTSTTRFGFVPPAEPNESGRATQGRDTNSWFSYAKYQPLFDVDTEEVVSRCASAISAAKMGASREDFCEKPDLYGPFWTCATLVFAAAAAGNFADWIKADESGGKWQYDVAKITFAALLFYGYASVVPLAMYVTLRVWDARVKLASLLCFYGYALVAFVPTSLLCAVPVPMLAWIAILVSVVVSALFLAVAVRGTVSDAGLEAGKTSLLLMVAAGFHLALGIALKVYFFRY